MRAAGVGIQAASRRVSLSFSTSGIAAWGRPARPAVRHGGLSPIGTARIRGLWIPGRGRPREGGRRPVLPGGRIMVVQSMADARRRLPRESSGRIAGTCRDRPPGGGRGSSSRSRGGAASRSCRRSGCRAGFAHEVAEWLVGLVPLVAGGAVLRLDGPPVARDGGELDIGEGMATATAVVQSRILTASSSACRKASTKRFTRFCSYCLLATKSSQPTGSIRRAGRAAPHPVPCG